MKLERIITNEGEVLITASTITKKQTRKINKQGFKISYSTS